MKGFNIRKSIFTATVAGSVFLTGCIVPNKDLISLRNDVDELKKETIRIQRTAGIKPDSGKSRIDEIEKEIEFLSRDFKKTRAASDANMNSMRGEIQALGGRFEEVKHLTEKTSDDNRSFLTAVDSRLNAIEMKIEKAGRELDELRIELELIKKAATEEKERKKEAEISSTDLYKSGLDAIKKGNTKEARDLFNSYLKTFPDGPLANNAQFWIGESFYDEGDFERSIIEYDDVIKKYPGGGKVPAALLKQGMAFAKIKDMKTSEALYNKLIKQYPDTDEAKTARKLLDAKKSKK